MYFSTTNKNHMFQLISSVVSKETGKNISGNQVYLKMFKDNYSIIFDKTSVDTISEINKELLNYVGHEIISVIQNEYHKQNITIINSDSIDSDIDSMRLESIPESILMESVSILSSDRLSESINRYHYQVQLEDVFQNLSLSKIEIVKENNILFSNPNIIVKISSENNSYFIDCEMIGKKTLDKEYISYQPPKHISIPIQTDKITIQLLNYLKQPIKLSKDVFQLIRAKILKINKINYLVLETNDNDNIPAAFSVNDLVGIFENNKCIYTSPIKIIKDVFLLSEDINLIMEKDKNYTLMNMSLQHKFDFKCNN